MVKDKQNLIYLDHASTTYIRDELYEAIYDTQSNQDNFFGADSLTNVSALAAEIAQIESRQVDSPTFFAKSKMFQIKATTANSQVSQPGGDNADYISTKNLGPFTFNKTFAPTTLGSLAGIEVKPGKEFLGITLRDRKFKIDNAILRYGGDPDAWFGMGGTNDFPKTPAGLNDNNKLTYKSFREVADPGKNNHPLVLRDIGNN